MQHSKIRSALAALLCASAFAAQSLPSRAADFSGETVEWTIPFGVGGGTDVWARFFAPQLADTLPGKPTVVVLNVPGGGSITGANQFAMRAGSDGLEILDPISGDPRRSARSLRLCRLDRGPRLADGRRRLCEPRIRRHRS